MNNNFNFDDDKSLVSDMLLFYYNSIVRLRQIHTISGTGEFTINVRDLLSENDKNLLKRLTVPQFNDVSMLTMLKKKIEHTLYCKITTGILDEVYIDDPTFPKLSTSNVDNH